MKTLRRSSNGRHRSITPSWAPFCDGLSSSSQRALPFSAPVAAPERFTAADSVRRLSSRHFQAASRELLLASSDPFNTFILTSLLQDVNTLLDTQVLARNRTVPSATVSLDDVFEVLGSSVLHYTTSTHALLEASPSFDLVILTSYR